MAYKELVTDDGVFSSLRAECDEVFESTCRLPERVFRPGFDAYFAFEHASILRPEFAAFLTEVGIAYSDKTVQYMSLDPDPVEYYKNLCGFYGLASFELQTLRDRYVPVMYREGAADSFRARGGDVAVIWGSSLKWGIYCDRISWELCIMGTKGELSSSVARAFKIFDGALLESYLVGQYANKQAAVHSFLKRLSENYPALGLPATK
jgi:hypothetical protein